MMNSTKETSIINQMVLINLVKYKTRARNSVNYQKIKNNFNEAKKFSELLEHILGYRLFAPLMDQLAQ